MVSEGPTDALTGPTTTAVGEGASTRGQASSRPLPGADDFERHVVSCMLSLRAAPTHLNHGTTLSHLATAGDVV